MTRLAAMNPITTESVLEKIKMLKDGQAIPDDAAGDGERPRQQEESQQVLVEKVSGAACGRSSHSVVCVPGLTQSPQGKRSAPPVGEVS